MKKIKFSIVLFYALLLVSTLLSTTSVFATNTDNTTQSNKEQLLISENDAYSHYEYVLDSYDVSIIVHEDNTFTIIENIVAYFNVPKHGIIRSLPLKNTINRLDGSKSTNRVKIENINVNNTFSAYIESGEQIIKIGDANTTLLGPQQYTINYVVDIGKDPAKEYDEFYYNLIGTDWDTVIGNVTFSIAMPKEFDESQLGFSLGEIGAQNNEGITYRVDGNVISGSYYGVLNPSEALTVRVELAEGYFINTSSGLDLFLILSFVIPIIFVLLSIFLWMRIGNDDPVVETVEFYPPEGFNSAEVGFLYKGKATSDDVVSLLIYLANKGYIKISEIDEHALFIKSTSFKLSKLRDYDGDDENERIFLNGLFKTRRRPVITSFRGFIKTIKDAKNNQDVNSEENFNSRDEVTSDELHNSFFSTVNTIVTSLNRKENKHMIFEKTSMGKGFIAAIMIIVIYFLITVKPVIEYGDPASLPFALLFPGIGFTVLFGMVFGKTMWPIKLFGLVWGLGFGGMPWAIMVLPALLADWLYVAVYISGLVCVFIIVMMFRVMPKRTAYGNELLGKIRGFKTFLETAEKSKLEMLVFDDPSYFYNILPYTYVLGVSDKWIKKFEVIALEAPDWYDSKTSFSPSNFGSFMNSTMSTASSVMASSPSSGGGSSGGGSSGGGSGGGGGSSW